MVDSPTAKESVVLSRVMDSVFTETVTSHSAEQVPDLAVIVALPDLWAVILPFDTEAMASSEDVQTTALSVALSGCMVAVRVSVSPTCIDKLALSNEIDVTAMIFAETLADFPPALAVIVAVPSLRAVTVPELTLATEALDEAQVTPSYSASFGRTVATRLKVSPSTISIVAVFNDTDDTSTCVSFSVQPNKSVKKKHITRLNVLVIIFIFML